MSKTAQFKGETGAISHPNGQEDWRILNGKGWLVEWLGKAREIILVGRHGWELIQDEGGKGSESTIGEVTTCWGDTLHEDVKMGESGVRPIWFPHRLFLWTPGLIDGARGRVNPLVICEELITNTPDQASLLAKLQGSRTVIQKYTNGLAGPQWDEQRTIYIQDNFFTKNKCKRLYEVIGFNYLWFMHGFPVYVSLKNTNENMAKRSAFQATVRAKSVPERDISKLTWEGIRDKPGQ